MDEFCKQIILEVTGSEKIIACLELCDIKEDVDVINIDDKVIDRIETFTRECCLLMLPDKMQCYMDERFYNNPSRFLISPGIRIKLLRSVKIIAERYQKKTFLSLANTYNSLQNNSTGSNNNNDDGNSSVGDNNQFLDSISDFKLFNSNLLGSDLSSEEKTVCVEAWSKSIVHRAAKIFLGANLEPKIDFDMDMETSYQNGVPKRTGIFHCHICRATRGSSATVRFSISKLNYVIFSNIMTHLRLHFRRRKNFENATLPKYSKLRLDNDSVLKKETLLL